MPRRRAIKRNVTELAVEDPEVADAPGLTVPLATFEKFYSEKIAEMGYDFAYQPAEKYGVLSYPEEPQTAVAVPEEKRTGARKSAQENGSNASSTSGAQSSTKSSDTYRKKIRKH